VTRDKRGFSRVHVIVRGRVQGVGFRFFTVRVAKELGVTGFVRNLPDGTVEIVAEGDVEKLAKLVEAVRRGPPLARVTGLDVKWESYKGEYKGFYIEF